MHLSRLVATAAVAATVACGSSSPTSPNNPNPVMGITIQDFSFSPTSLTVQAGTTVRWTNNGPSAHTTVSDAGVWNSGTLNAPVSGGGGYGGGGSAGGTFEFTFTQPGDYPYHCSLHPPALYPGFTGIVKVTS